VINTERLIGSIQIEYKVYLS